jgi:hypothetical protein
MRQLRKRIKTGRFDLVDQERSKLIPSKYPEEFEEICKLLSLSDKNARQEKDGKIGGKVEGSSTGDSATNDLVYHLKLKLADVVSVYKRRFSGHRCYFDHITKCIRLARTASDDLESIVACMGKLDGSHILALWDRAAHLGFNRFAQQEYIELLKQISSMGTTLQILAAVLPYATGVSDAKRGRGRPKNPYFPAVLEIIDLWEFVTSKPFPVAKKKLEKGEPDKTASQTSTEFCRLVFRMIDQNITLPEVRTAINNALNVRKLGRTSQ